MKPSWFSYPHVTSTLALVFAMAGTGIAAVALEKDSVDSKHIKEGAVRSSEAKELGVKDFDFPLGFGAVEKTNSLTPPANQFTTVATLEVDLSPRDVASLATVIGTTEIQDNGQVAGPTDVTLRLLEDGQPSGPVYTTRVADSATETVGIMNPCQVEPGESETLEVQVSLSQASTIGDRAYEGYLGPVMAEPPAAP